MVKINKIAALAVAVAAVVAQSEEEARDLEKRTGISWENIWNVKSGAMIAGTSTLCAGVGALMASYASLKTCTTVTTVIAGRATVAVTDNNNATARYDHDMEFLTAISSYGNWTDGINSTLVIDSNEGSVAMTGITSNGTHVTAHASAYSSESLSKRTVSEMEFVYHATTTASDGKCGSTAELAMYVTACESALNTMSTNTRKTTCDRFSHGGTWRGHLVSAGVYSGYVYSVGKSCT